MSSFINPNPNVASGELTRFALAGAFANGTIARQLINLFENTETTSLNALQTGGWGPVPDGGIWQMTAFEVSHTLPGTGPGLTFFGIWRMSEPYGVNATQLYDIAYTAPAGPVPPAGTAVTIDPVNNEVDGVPVIPGLDLPHTFDLNFPTDVIVISLDPTGSMDTVRWRAIFEKLP